MTDDRPMTESEWRRLKAAEPLIGGEAIERVRLALRPGDKHANVNSNDLRTLLAMSSKADDVVLVPREATQAMIDAAAATPGMKACNDTMVMHQARGYSLDPEAFRDGSPLHQAWRAMVAASLTMESGDGG